MTAELSVLTALNTANPNNLPDALKVVALGTLLAGKKVTVSQTAAATIALSPPALTGTIQCRVTTVGTATAGIRAISDAAATPSATLATISDDGATLTFEGTVTGAIISYVPRPTDAQLAAALYPQT